MKLFLSFCTILFIQYSLALSAFSQTSTQQISLNGNWNFKIDPDNTGLPDKWFSSNDHRSWDKMNVPGNWDLQNEYNDYAGLAWYQRHFDLPSIDPAKNIYLRFEGVYFQSKVWLNGVLLGTNSNGFLPFEFDVTKLLRPANNSLVVLADNTFRLGAVWNWGGIRRDVSLIVADPVRVVQQHINPDVDLKTRKTRIHLKLFLSNHCTKDELMEGVATILKGSTALRKIPFRTSIPAGESKEIQLSDMLKPSEVQLWHFDEPHLYTSSITLNTPNGPVFQISDRFGIRKVEIDHAKFEFRLNGEPVRLMGLNLVAEDRTSGNTLPLWRIKEDIDMMKELGSNLTRITHLPLPKEAYDYLDERGMMVFPEVSLWGFSKLVDPSHKLPREWLQRMVQEYFNHPSIIGWSVGNEIGWNPMAMDYTSSAIGHAKQLDPSRLAVVVSHTAHDSLDIIGYSDLGMINKYGSNLGPVTRRQHRNHPSKLLFYSEFGDVQASEDLDTRTGLEGLIDSLRFKSYLMGASIWTFNDYRSNYKGTRELSGNRAWGVVDVFRRKKRNWRVLRNENAPLESLDVSTENHGGQTMASVIIKPRPALDLPSFKLRNYRLAWHVRDSSGAVINGGFTLLKNISPADKPVKTSFSWENMSAAHALDVAVVNPLGYTVSDTTLFFKRPAPPLITGVSGFRTNLQPGQGKNGAIRVYFQPDKFGSEYKLKYGPGLSQETAATINPFLDITALPPGKKYDLALVAVNSFGESEPAYLRSQSIEFITAPPLIRYVEAADSGFFIGYSNLLNDYMFEIQITTDKGRYEGSKVLFSRVKGLTNVRGLANGQKYFFRMRRIDEDMVPGAWSYEYEVIPDGGLKPEPPNFEAVFKHDRTALICFQPIRKATAYRLRFRDKNTDGWTYRDIPSAAARYFILNGIDGSEYDFEMASMNQYGISGYSPVSFYTK